MVNIPLENSTNLWKYDIWYTVTPDWNTKIRPHKLYFFELREQLFQENLGTGRLPIKLEGTLAGVGLWCRIKNRLTSDEKKLQQYSCAQQPTLIVY